MINVWEHVNADAEARQFCDIYGLDGPVLIDDDGSYIARLGVRGVPANVVVDQDGIVRAVGATSPDELRAAIAAIRVEID